MWEYAKHTIAASPWLKMALVLAGIALVFFITQSDSARPRDGQGLSNIGQLGVGEKLEGTGQAVVDSVHKGGQIVSKVVDTTGVVVDTASTVIDTGAKVVNYGAGVVKSFLP